MSEEISEADAIELQIAETEEHKRELQSQGWVWSGEGIDKVLAHPNDLDLNRWFDPYAGRQLLSPKLVELLKSEFSVRRQIPTKRIQWS